MKLVGMCAALLCACVTTGCVTDQVAGVPPTLQQSSLVAEQNLQEMMVTSLIRKADLSREALVADPSKWRVVADAGLFEVDVQCDRYLAALFAFNRDQRAGRQILTAAGAGTAAIMGITGAAGAAIAITAAAFGMAATVFDASTGSVLFTVSPVAVRAVANRGRQAFLEGIKWEQVNSRPRMMMVVQGYLSQCTPAAIEANIDNAATGAPSVSNLGTALQAAALASPASSVVQDPVVFTASPTTGPRGVPAVIPEGQRPRNVTAAELPFLRTKSEVEDLQRALGTNPDGNIGQSGLADPGPTRKAISEYHAGLLRSKGRDNEAGSEIMDAGNYRALVRAGAMPSGLNSAFERGLLGDRPTCFTIADALHALTAPVPPKNTSDADCMRLMREALAKRRAQPGMPVPTGRPEALDLKLFDAGPPRRKIADPT